MGEIVASIAVFAVIIVTGSSARPRTDTAGNSQVSYRLCLTSCDDDVKITY
jgi:hypothetical protein